LKILQVIDRLDIGGAERVCVDLSNILTKHNEQVSLLLLSGKGVLFNELEPRIKVFELKRGNKFNLLSLFKCYQIITQFDIIHCHFKHVYRYIAVVSKLFPIPGKVILQDHGYTLKPARFLKNLLHPKYYIGVSEKLTKWASEELNIKKENIFLLKNIVIRKHYQHCISKKYDLILVSNIKPKKNHEFVIRLLNVLPDNNLLIVGKIQDDRYFSYLKSIVKNKNIHFKTDVHDVQPLISTAKIGLHSSRSETGPLVLMEYLAQGIPFLAYETGEVANLIREIFPTFFINNFEVSKWVERLGAIENINIPSDSMTSVFEKFFSVEDYYKKCKTIYHALQN
jgi:glycosyltransferase involved in cell wall biosynthesis